MILDTMYLFGSISHFKRTNPRDKLYGILGLRGILSLLAVNIIINHGDTVWKVYVGLVLAFIRYKCQLSLLSGAGIGYKANYPSLDLPLYVLDLGNFYMFRVKSYEFNDN